MTEVSEVPEDLWRALAPPVLGALVRRYGHFDLCEDAVQEALLAAAVQWPRDGVPEEPRTWLIRVASRRLIDLLRSEQARQERERAYRVPVTEPAPGDDSLILLFLCCHPALSGTSQIALTLRAVGGLSTAEVARLLLTPEPTMAQRISRAKATIRSSGIAFRLPRPDERRLPAVLHVLYLIFTEGYAAGRGELAGEAIRLARLLRALLPEDGEVAGLLALMLLTDARRAARTTAAGALVPLEEQDRGRWDAAAIAEGTALVTAALTGPGTGPYGLQAAIAAVHDEAPRAEDTDWRQILALYVLLERLTDNPVVTLNRAVAVAMVHGPAAGLALLDTLTGDARLARGHRLAAVRAHLLERAGVPAEALTWYRIAAERTTNTAEQRYLQARAARLRAAAVSPAENVVPPG